MEIQHIKELTSVENIPEEAVTKFSLFNLYLRMQFSEILGQESIKTHLIQSANEGRIPHAQLFVGPEGSGTLPMAIAYAQYILCSNTGNENSNGNSSCNIKFENLAHPDLHFVYPTAIAGESKPMLSTDFVALWREMLSENMYANLFDWYSTLEVGNKQGFIRVDEAANILKLLSLKAYEGGHKVMIIWMADRLNTDAANKLLKILEEPPEKTIFILITENEGDIISTIRSRCQVLHFAPISNDEIAKKLEKDRNIETHEARKIAHQAQGNFNRALKLTQSNEEEFQFERWFVEWVRAAFRAKGNPSSILELISWSETIAPLGRETQKKFLNYCIELFRQALLLNFQTTELVYMEPKVEKFKLENFAPFVHGNNIQDIFTALSDAIYHIERNGNAKMILTDMSIKLTRLIHKK